MPLLVVTSVALVAYLATNVLWALILALLAAFLLVLRCFGLQHPTWPRIPPKDENEDKPKKML